jgi:DNA-binding NtrC family response regulator
MRSSVVEGGCLSSWLPGIEGRTALKCENSHEIQVGKVSAYGGYNNYNESLTMKILNRDAVEFLLIDDDPAITKFLVTYLKQKGHTCEFLTEGFQTAAWLEHHKCDVVVVDLNMPKVDGISLISFIREMSQTLPIIVFTGVGYDEERMHAALRAGANGYVSKNLPIEQLYCVLSRVLATCQQRARREALARPQHVLAGAA